MASDDRPPGGPDEPDTPSIAPPSIGLRRKKKAQPEPVDETEPGIVAGDPAIVAEPAVEPAAAAVRKTIFGARPKPTPARPSAAPGPVPVPDPTPMPSPTPIPQPSPIPEPTPSPLPTPVPSLIPAPEPLPAPTPVPDPPPMPDPEPIPEPEPVAPPGREPSIPGPGDPAPTAASKKPSSKRPRRPPQELTAPAWLTGRLAAAMTGAVVGLMIVAAVALSLQGCQLVRNAATCGGGPGTLLLLASLGLGILLGATLLRLAQLDGPTSTSILAVALMAVLVMVFVLGSIYAWWMVIVIPLVCAATYSLSHWATMAFAEEGADV